MTEDENDDSEQIYYLAYGSNLHPRRLSERVPSARLVGTVALPGWQLFFHKRSGDSSGKCNLLQTGDSSNIAFGAIYQMAASEKPILDYFEACGFGYEAVPITVEFQYRSYTCFTYAAQENYIESSLKPYPWYRDLVYLGALHHDFPKNYLETINTTPTIPDADDDRCAIHRELIERIRSTAVPATKTLD